MSATQLKTAVDKLATSKGNIDAVKVLYDRCVKGDPKREANIQREILIAEGEVSGYRQALRDVLGLLEDEGYWLNTGNTIDAPKLIAKIKARLEQA